MDMEVEKSSDKQAEEAIENPVEQEVESTADNEMDTTALETEDLIDAEKKDEKPVKKYGKVAISIMTLCFLLILYGGMAAYFANHFYFGSEVNCINISGKTVEAAEASLESELQKYTLTLRKRDGGMEQIKAADIDLRYTSLTELKKLKESQNPFHWILACFKTKDSKIEVEVKYDEKMLKNHIENLACFDNTKAIEPRSPDFQYVEDNYIIVDEIPGNRVNKGILYSRVTKALLSRETELDLEASNCYIKPQYHSKSPKILEVRDNLNKYVSTQVTYTIGNHHEILDRSIINKWLMVDSDFNIIVDDKKVNQYIETLSAKYDTKGKTRSFTTSYGETIQVGGGDFGRAINKVKEAESLIAAIKEGQKITKEPLYSQTVFSKESSDIADTYVEIDMTRQYMWFYKNGSLIVAGDIVTGNVKAGNTTPKGVYSLKYKAKNVVLRGPGYAAPVSFWMPFNRGIGIHDASWRNVFGGNIYKTDGSHGCINSPYHVAKEIYNHIEPGTPVICY